MPDGAGRRPRERDPPAPVRRPGPPTAGAGFVARRARRAARKLYFPAGGAGGGLVAGGGGGVTARCGDRTITRAKSATRGRGARGGNGPRSACSADCKVTCPSDGFGAAAVATRDPATNHSYVAVSEGVSYFDAEAACRSLPLTGFHLASLRALTETAFVEAHFPLVEPMWIGLHDDVKDGQTAWAWQDGSLPGFVDPEEYFWFPGEPGDHGQTNEFEGGEEECVLLASYSDYEFADAFCAQDAYYLCEYSPAPL